MEDITGIRVGVNDRHVEGGPLLLFLLLRVGDPTGTADADHDGAAHNQ